MSDNTHPNYYTLGGVEAIDVIAAWGLCFWLGNVIKYVARAGRKPGAVKLDDLRKARAYLDDKIARLETAPSTSHERTG